MNNELVSLRERIAKPEVENKKLKGGKENRLNRNQGVPTISELYDGSNRQGTSSLLFDRQMSQLKVEKN